MSRKVYLTVKARTLVPIITTHNIILTVEEGQAMETVIRKILAGKQVDAVLEDTSITKIEVENGEEPLDGELQAIHDFLESDDASTKYVDHEVTDSK